MKTLSHPRASRRDEWVRPVDRYIGKKKGQERIDIQIEMVAVSRREHAMLRVDPYLIVHPQPAPSLTTGSTTPPLSTQTQ